VGILSEILAVKPRTRLSTAVQKAPVQQYVNAEHLVPIGITVPLERPTPFVDARPVVTKRLSAKDQFLLIDAFLSKYPHYKFVKKTKSGWTSEIKYWFHDKSRGVTVVATYEDIESELHASITTSERTREVKGDDSLGRIRGNNELYKR